jgi:hypothetical protein
MTPDAYRPIGRSAVLGKNESLICPLCGAALESGFVSYCSGAIWHREEPTGMSRMFWSAFPTGERVYGGVASYPFVSSVPGLRCSECSGVVVPESS